MLFGPFRAPVLGDPPGFFRSLDHLNTPIATDSAGTVPGGSQSKATSGAGFTGASPQYRVLIKVQVRPNESLESALRRFKRQCNYSGIFRLFKAHTWHEKRSDKRRRERRERLRTVLKAARRNDPNFRGRNARSNRARRARRAVRRPPANSSSESSSRPREEGAAAGGPPKTFL